MLTKEINGLLIGFVQVNAKEFRFRIDNKISYLFAYNSRTGRINSGSYALQREHQWQLVGNTVAAQLKDDEWQKIGAQNSLAGLLYLAQEKLNPNTTVIIKQTKQPMPTNKEIEELIDFVKRGGWVKASDKLPDNNWKGEMRNKTSSGKWHYEENVPAEMIIGLAKREYNLEIEWQDDSTKEQLLSLLSCLVNGESDEEVAERYSKRWTKGKQTLSIEQQELIGQIFTDGLTHARLQKQAEIKALEEKVAKVASFKRCDV